MFTKIIQRSDTDTCTKPAIEFAERIFMHLSPRLLIETQEEFVDDIADSLFAVILQAREMSTSTKMIKLWRRMNVTNIELNCAILRLPDQVGRRITIIRPV